jgi:two-component system CheB/CheR fusion protein
MYFNANVQTRILTHFHFALNEAGFLFLGKSEMLLTQSNLFVPVDLKRRVFKKVSRVSDRDRLLMTGQGGYEENLGPTGNHLRIREESFDAGPVAQIVVDTNGFLVFANQQARALLRVSQQDVGRLLQDLELSYRPVEVRSLIEQAYAERRLVSRKGVEWVAGPGDACFLDIDVMPLVTTRGALIGATATYMDVTRIVQLSEALQRTRDELETSYEELQSTVEELETTNEELQSTNEELETTNEELQSTNEELETMNEEQQSTNEELEAMNDELQRRTEEVTHLNLFLESILTSVRIGVVVLNPDMRIQVWNRKAEDLWGLRSDEVVGEHFLNLDITLELEQLKHPIRQILSGEHAFNDSVQHTLNRRGKPLECKITMVQRNDGNKDIQGVILLMEEVDNVNLARRADE